MTGARGRFAGMTDIVRFNPGSFLAAGTLFLFAATLLPEIAAAERRFLLALLLPAAWWTAASLAVSHFVYDRSPVADWAFLADLVPSGARTLRIQVGFDPSHGEIDRRLGSGVTAVDLFAPPEVGGASVARAKRLHPGPALPRELPREGVFDVVLAPFALHEVRSRAGRDRIFVRLVELLAPGGRLVVLEHARDAANFLAFGPGFLHFLPAGEWRRLAAGSGLSPVSETRVTPFVRLLVWEKR